MNPYEPPQAAVADHDQRFEARQSHRLGVNVVAGFLLLVAIYFTWWATAVSEPLWLIGAVIAATCAVGLFLRKAWAEYLWYAIAALITAGWTASVFQVWRSGWPYQDLAMSIISLIPGALILLLCIGGCFVVAGHSRTKHNLS